MGAGGDASSADGNATAISTFLRVRPHKRKGHFTLPDEAAIEDGPAVVRAEVARDEVAGMVNNKRTAWAFGFDGVIGPQARQDEVFERVAEPVVSSVLEGYNGTVFAYGQTGSGKTYTLTGGVDAFADRGIVPRAISRIFAHCAASTGEVEHVIRISYLEIYNEVGYDLLGAVPTGGAAAGEGFTLPRISAVAEDEDGGVHLRGLGCHVAASEEEALSLLFVGDTNRAVCETAMNAASSRSHCVFTVHVEARPVGAPTVRRSKLQLVDLAGSERVAKTGASGTTLGEALHINRSLHFLELVITRLHERLSAKAGKAGRGGGKDTHVPYRNSMLTSVLRDSLGGNCKTVMVAAMHPASDHTDESISTCRFAQRVRMITNDVSRNEEVDPALLIERLRDENRRLRDAGAANEDDGGAELPQADLRALRRAVRAFVGDPSQSAQVEWGRGRRAAKVRHALWMLRQMIRGGSGGGGTVGGGGGDEEEAEDGGGVWSGGEEQGEEGGAEDGASQEEQLRRRIAILTGQLRQRDEAVASLEAKVRLLARGGGSSCGSEGGSGGGAGKTAPLPSHSTARDDNRAVGEEAAALVSRDAARRLFATSFERGATLLATLTAAQGSLKPKLDDARALGAALVAAREDIASAKRAVESRRVQTALAGLSEVGADEGADADGAVDEEEARLAGVLHGLKEAYRAKAHQLKQLKVHVGALQASCGAAQSAFDAEFRAWWASMRHAHGMAAEDDALRRAATPLLGEAPPPPATAKGSEIGDSAGERRAPPSLAQLRDPEASLALFRSEVWSEAARSRRERLKAELSDAVSQAKESGALVTRKRDQVARLKESLSAHLGAGGSAADEEAIRARLDVEKEGYRDEVSALRSLKRRVEELQASLDGSQEELRADFAAWHAPALAQAERREGGSAGAARSGAPPGAPRRAWD